VLALRGVPSPSLRSRRLAEGSDMTKRDEMIEYLNNARYSFVGNEAIADRMMGIMGNPSADLQRIGNVLYLIAVVLSAILGAVIAK
jgi:hypothetical protein